MPRARIVLRLASPPGLSAEPWEPESRHVLEHLSARSRQNDWQPASGASHCIAPEWTRVRLLAASRRCGGRLHQRPSSGRRQRATHRSLRHALHLLLHLFLRLPRGGRSRTTSPNFCGSPERVPGFRDFFESLSEPLLRVQLLHERLTRLEKPIRI